MRWRSMTRARRLVSACRVKKAFEHPTVEIDHYDMVVKGLEDGIARDAGFKSW